jgi:hypothetical protein
MFKLIIFYLRIHRLLEDRLETQDHIMTEMMIGTLDEANGEIQIATMKQSKRSIE